MLFLRSALTNSLCAIYCFSVAILCLPFVYLFPGLAKTVLHACARFILCVLKYVSGITYQIHGEKNLSHTPALYVANHQSMWETIALFQLIPNSVFVVKKSLLSIPFAGVYLRKYGLIGIDRGNKSILKRLITQVKKATQNHHSLIIFPEGRRMPPGAPGKLNPSFALLAQEAGLPIIPITHNSGEHWPRRSFYKYPGTIHLTIHPPIAPTTDKETTHATVTYLFHSAHSPV